MIHVVTVYFYLDPKLGSHGNPNLLGARLERGGTLASGVSLSWLLLYGARVLKMSACHSCASELHGRKCC